MLSASLNYSLAIMTPKPEPVFAVLVQENAQAVEDLFNSSFENCDDSGDLMVCSKDVMPMPIAKRNPYEVKQRDIISGNVASATNVTNLKNTP